MIGGPYELESSNDIDLHCYNCGGDFEGRDGDECPDCGKELKEYSRYLKELEY